MLRTASAAAVVMACRAKIRDRQPTMTPDEFALLSILHRLATNSLSRDIQLSDADLNFIGLQGTATPEQ